MVLGVLRAVIDLVGKRLAGKYKIVRSLESSGMSVSYLGVTEDFYRRVHISVFHPDLLGDATALRRFKRAADASATLDHPHIVQFLDFVWERDVAPFVVEEYLSGETLRSTLKRYGRITPARAARIAMQVLGGLGAAHRANIVHRDIKPENIFLVRSSAAFDLVKVLNFTPRRSNGTPRDRSR